MSALRVRQSTHRRESKMSSLSRRRLPMLAPAFAMVAAVALSACGSDDEGRAAASNVSAEECIAKASEYIEPWDTPPTALPAEYTALKAKPKTGIEVAWIAFLDIPDSQTEVLRAEELAEELDWDLNVIQSQYSPEDFASKFKEAIDSKPDAIMLESGDAFNIDDLYAEAEAAGIIVSQFGTKKEPTGEFGLAASLSPLPEFEIQGEIAANWVMRDSDCAANVALFNFPSESFEAAGAKFEDTVLDNCADCKISGNETVQITDVGTPTLTSAIVSKVQSDPSIDYVGISLGSMSTGVAAALKTAGLDDVKIFVLLPNSADIEALRKGDEAMAMLRSPSLTPYLHMDAVMRVMDTRKPVKGLPYPHALITPETVPDEGGAETTVFPSDYKEQFKALWNVG